MTIVGQFQDKQEVMERLRQEILAAQGFRAVSATHSINMELSAMEDAFPGKVFPTGAVHEFLSPSYESATASAGFIAGLLSRILQHKGACLWIATKRTLFPPALAAFGIEPDQVIFLDLVRESDALWVMEEALKCEALGAVVGEIREIGLTQSRRLQLAVEQSRVTGFLHRISPAKTEHIAAVSRWQISPVASTLQEGIPGVGCPRWSVELLKVRNGKPGRWIVQWVDNKFETIIPNIETNTTIYLKTG